MKNFISDQKAIVELIREIDNVKENKEQQRLLTQLQSLAKDFEKKLPFIDSALRVWRVSHEGLPEKQTLENMVVAYSADDKIEHLLEETAKESTLAMSYTYVHYGHKHFDKDMFRPVQNPLFLNNKPSNGGGLWASPEYDGVFGWKEWNEQENYRVCSPDNCFRFKLAKEARVLAISNKQMCDLLYLLGKTWLGIELVTENNEKHNTYNSLIQKIKYMGEIFIDFVLIQKYFDAIFYRVTPETYWGLYGWDCDSILVLNPDVILEKEDTKNTKN